MRVWAEQACAFLCVCVCVFCLSVGAAVGNVFEFGLSLSAPCLLDVPQSSALIFTVNQNGSWDSVG